MVALRIIGIVMFCIWLTVVLLGKGRFYHLLLLGAVGVAMVDAMIVIRTRMTGADKNERFDVYRHQND